MSRGSSMSSRSINKRSSSTPCASATLRLIRYKRFTTAAVPEQAVALDQRKTKMSGATAVHVTDHDAVACDGAVLAILERRALCRHGPWGRTFEHLQHGARRREPTQAVSTEGAASGDRVQVTPGKVVGGTRATARRGRGRGRPGEHGRMIKLFRNGCGTGLLEQGSRPCRSGAGRGRPGTSSPTQSCRPCARDQIRRRSRSP